ncbi:unannotated protein [freshwater metagenome]|uniref:Unannotated protein n=1 Tax=freshwater metagenome TaxID=449393 RepID=A0A6J7DSS6_9ZZZZ
MSAVPANICKGPQHQILTADKQYAGFTNFVGALHASVSYVSAAPDAVPSREEIGFLPGENLRGGVGLGRKHPALAKRSQRLG